MRLLLTILLLSTLACSSLKKEKTTPTVTDISMEESQEKNWLLNDIWVLQEMKMEEKSVIGKEFQRVPQMEFNLKEMRLMGNDGCNQIFGSIEEVNSTVLKFGSVGGTKKYCVKSADLTKQFREALKATTAYKISNLQLYFFDENKKQLLKFRKVD